MAKDGHIDMDAFMIDDALDYIRSVYEDQEWHKSIKKKKKKKKKGKITL